MAVGLTERPHLAQRAVPIAGAVADGVALDRDAAVHVALVHAVLVEHADDDGYSSTSAFGGVGISGGVWNVLLCLRAGTMHGRQAAHRDSGLRPRARGPA